MQMQVAENFLKNFPGYEIVGISIPKLGEEYLFYNCISGAWILSQCTEGIEYNACQIIVKKKYIFLTQSEFFEEFAEQIMQFKRREAYLMQYSDSDNAITVLESPAFNNYSLIYNFIESIDESGKVTFEKIGYKLKK